MIDKSRRLLTALAKESAKRVPWIVLVLVILLIFQGYHNTQISRDNSTDTKSLLNKVASLSEDNKKLSQENQALSQQGIQLAQQNAAHIDCIKQLFVDYVNTGTAISKANADKCTVNAVVSTPQQPQETANPQVQTSLTAKPETTKPSNKSDKSNPPPNPTPAPPKTLLQGAIGGVLDILKFIGV